MEKMHILDKEHWQEEKRHKNKTEKKLAEKALKYKLKVKEQRKLIKDNKSPKLNSFHKSKLQRDQTKTKKKHRVPETPLMHTYL